MSTAVRISDSTLTKRKCREALASEARMEEFKSHLSGEVGRLVCQCQSMPRDALEEFADGCRAVTEEEVKAIVKPEPESENCEVETPIVKLVCAVPRVEMGSVGRMKVVKTLPYSGLQKTEPKLGDLGFKLESAGSWES